MLFLELALYYITVFVSQGAGVEVHGSLVYYGEELCLERRFAMVQLIGQLLL
jgi:hypothetical protein